MLISSHTLLLDCQTRNHSPLQRICPEKSIIVKIRLGRSQSKSSFQTSKICNHFFLYPVSIDGFLLFIRNNTIQISDDRIRTILKFYIILIRPPHIQITIFIILCAGRIKGMGNLMTYGRVDCQFFFIVHVFTVHRRHQ